MPLLEKQCSRCKQVLPVESFGKRAASRDGLKSECKQCNRQYNMENPITGQTNNMIKNARKRAKDKKVPFDIDHDYIRSIVPSHCPVFGTPLEWSLQRAAQSIALGNSPSLDRIVPERGYVKGNVWIISHRANTIKNDASHEELKLVTKAVGEAIVNSLEF